MNYCGSRIYLLPLDKAPSEALGRRIEVKGALSFMAAVVFVVLFAIAFKKNRVAFLGLLFTTVPLLPVLYIPALGEDTFTERYLYLPSVGYAILLAVLLIMGEGKAPL